MIHHDNCVRYIWNVCSRCTCSTHHKGELWVTYRYIFIYTHVHMYVHTQNGICIYVQHTYTGWFCFNTVAAFRGCRWWRYVCEWLMSSWHFDEWFVHIACCSVLMNATCPIYQHRTRDISMNNIYTCVIDEWYLHMCDRWMTSTHVCCYLRYAALIRALQHAETHWWRRLGAEMARGPRRRRLGTLRWRARWMSRTHESFRTPRTHEARYLRPFAFSNTQHSNTLRITLLHTAARLFEILCVVEREVGGWGRDPKKRTGRDWGMGSSTI